MCKCKHGMWQSCLGSVDQIYLNKKKGDSFIFLRVKHFEKCTVQLQGNANSEIVQKEN